MGSGRSGLEVRAGGMHAQIQFAKILCLVTRTNPLTVAE
jgi:hypothetical protein